MIYEVLFFYIKYYIMITKFNCQDDNYKAIEFSKTSHNQLEIEVIDEEIDERRSVYLTEKDLFNLIGQLLRIQSEIRTEVKNG